MNKYLIMLLTLLLIGNASATQINEIYTSNQTTAELYYCNGSEKYFYNVAASQINVIYTSNQTTAELYYCNGSEKYFYNATNTLSDNFNTIMFSGHTDNNDDLIENPLIASDKLLFPLAIVFFSFMFLIIVYL